MIDKAFAELKQMHSTMMGHDLPLSTAGVSPAVPRVTGGGTPPAPAPKGAKGGTGADGKPGSGGKKDGQLNAKKNNDADNNHVPPNTPKKDAKKAANERRKQRRAVLAEHLTDYYKTKAPLSKVIHHGRLHEHNDSPGRGGIDHLWYQSNVPVRRYIVCDTKSSFLESFSLMAALPKELQAQFAAFRADEAAAPMNPNQPNEYPSTPLNENRDAHEDTNVKVHSKDAKAVESNMNPAGKHKKTPSLPCVQVRRVNGGAHRSSWIQFLHGQRAHLFRNSSRTKRFDSSTLSAVGL